MEKSFEFEDAGRTFTCKVEDSRTEKTAAWWWFAVSGDGQRYAPFHYDKDDTLASVQERIVAYYDALIERRNAPREPWQGRRFGNPKPVGEQPK